MISIEFTHTAPHGEVVLVVADSSNQTALIKEVFTETGRKILVKPGSTRGVREKTGALLYKKANEGTEKTLVIDASGFVDGINDLLTGMFLASWRFNKYRTSLRPEEICTLEKVVILSDNPQHFKQNFRRTKAIIDGIVLARDLTSEPSNCLYPMAYAEALRSLEKHGLKVEILDEKALEEIGMTALLAVGQGSGHATAVACITWAGSDKTDTPIVLVGKGVCFDSGGLCTKPLAVQQEMKWDKAGAGVVAGTMLSLALNQSAAYVVGIIGLVENMPDGKAIKPSDVITTMSGQTIEIADPDCEGRLVLADCLWYAQERFKPKAIIDLGTLTPETFAALGSAYAGLYADSPELVEQLITAGKVSQDALWQLPMGEYFADQIQSNVADMKNTGLVGWGENGAAAEFLKRFIKPNVELWAHIDIAGVAWLAEDTPLCKKGPTGFGVRLLEEWITSIAQK